MKELSEAEKKFIDRNLNNPSPRARKRIRELLGTDSKPPDSDEINITELGEQVFGQAVNFPDDTNIADLLVPEKGTGAVYYRNMGIKTGRKPPPGWDEFYYELPKSHKMYLGGVLRDAKAAGFLTAGQIRDVEKPEDLRTAVRPSKVFPGKMEKIISENGAKFLKIIFPYRAR